MSDTQIAVIVERLERIEKQNRRMKAVGLFLILTVMAIVVAAAVDPNTPSSPATAVQKEVRAERIVIVDESGRERVVIGCHGYRLQSWGIVMGGADGKTRLVLDDGTNPSKLGLPSLNMYDHDGRHTVRLGLTLGGAQMWLQSPGLSEGDETKVRQYIELSAYESRGATVLVGGSNEGSVMVQASASADSCGGLLSVANKTGETVVELLADEYGNGVVGAYNRKGTGRTLKPGP